jgi:ketose-bisphosphate aldolase
MFAYMEQLQKRALQGKYAVPAFNFSTLEILQGIFLAGLKLKSPLIVETSHGSLSHFWPEFAKATVEEFSNMQKNIQVVLHLDHAKNYDLVKRCINIGYTSVHIDASSLPYKKNLRLTKKVVTYAHNRGVCVEGELGHVSGSSKLHLREKASTVLSREHMTDPDLAKEFVEATGVNTLAVFVGNLHGFWKGIHLDIPRLQEIHKKTKRPLVLHGGSGIPRDQVRKAIKSGITKMNVNTELRNAYATTLRKSINKNKDIVPYHVLPPSRNAVMQVCMEKIRLCGSNGKAGGKVNKELLKRMHPISKQKEGE